MRRTRSFTLAAVAVFTAAVIAVACVPPPPTDPGPTSTTVPGSSTTTTSTTTTTTTSTTSTTVPTGPTFPAPELVSVSPAGVATPSHQGDGPAVSSDGRLVMFNRSDSCGPVLRDRTAGTSTTFFAKDSAGFCDVLKPAMGMSSDGGRILVSKVSANCPPNIPGPPGQYVMTVLDVATGSTSEPLACGDKSFYGDAYAGGTGNSPVPLPQTTATNGLTTFAKLTGDGSGIVVLRLLTDVTYGQLATPGSCAGYPAGTPCYGVTSYRFRFVIDLVDADTGAVQRLHTIRDGGVVPTPGGMSTLPYHGFPYIQLGTTNADGSIVTLTTESSLVASDTNQRPDGYVLSTAAGTLAPVVTTAAGTSTGAVSSDGRFVVFSSGAADLVAGDTNGQVDLFLLDRQTGVVERQNIATDGTQADTATLAFPSSVSDDGRYVAFGSNATTLGCAGEYHAHYIRDRQQARTRTPFHAASGAPAAVGNYQGSAFSYTFSQLTGAVLVTPDGSTAVGVSSDWLGAPASDPGVAATRVWATPTTQAVPDC